MPNLNLTKAQVSDYSSLDAHSITPYGTEGVTGRETEYTNSQWSQYWAYFNDIPELKNAILLKAMWNVGKGWTASPKVESTLNRINGWGKDTFDDILFSLEVTRRINGDSFAEIIRDDEGNLINLKPLDPSSIKTIVDGSGIITRYEQTAKLGEKQYNRTFKPEEILHLSNNRLADQIHGISDIKAVEKVILADDESFGDMQKIVHLQAKPFIVFKLKTDNPTKIAEFATKIRSARSLGEDMFIPDDENLLSYEVIQVNPSNILMAWRDDMRNKFYRSIGLPQIVPGGGGQSTESESRVIYLAFEQIVASDQKFLEKQIWSQLGLKIKLIPPTTLMDMIGRDERKDGASVFNTQQSELNPNTNK